MVKVVQFRKATDSDLNILNQLLYRSEAFWGFDKAFMEKFISLYRLTEDILKHNIAWVMILDENGTDDIVGFFSLKPVKDYHELDYFYVKHDCLGQGLGKIMWQYMLTICCKHRIKELFWVTTPFALPFYQKMGASHTANVKSPVDGNRIIHQLKYVL